MIGSGGIYFLCSVCVEIVGAEGISGTIDQDLEIMYPLASPVKVLAMVLSAVAG